jgi:TonB family protein
VTAVTPHRPRIPSPDRGEGVDPQIDRAHLERRIREETWMSTVSPASKPEPARFENFAADVARRYGPVMRKAIARFPTLAAFALLAAPNASRAQKSVEDLSPPPIVAVGAGESAPRNMVFDPPRVHARPQAPLASYAMEGDYPAAAIRNREQGRVAVALVIGPEGRVTACTIIASSGSAALDAATCRILRSRARYAPARDARGNPVPDHDRGELTWTLPAD